MDDTVKVRQMSAPSHVRVVSTEGRDDGLGAARSVGSPALHRLAAPLRRAILQAREWLLSRQQPDGHWVGELEGDSILQSEYVLLLAWLGRLETPQARGAARTLLHQQLPAGGWAMYPGGGVEISASVKAYFALKLTGHDPSSEPLQRARRAILAHGGADAVNSFTRFYLALLGQISYDQCPAVPPELVLLPRWFPVNLYRVSAWSRTIIVPLSILFACRPVAQVASRCGIAELFLRPPQDWPPLRAPGKAAPRGFWSWDRFFRRVDRGLKFIERRRWLPLRKRALAAAERWMLDRFAGSDGLGAIFPPMVWSIVALKCLGYADDSPEVCQCLEQLDGLILDPQGMLRLQPCKSPVWDTALTLRALAASGLRSDHPAVARGCEWLLEREIRRAGDWSQTVAAEPAGWCFEYANEFYPDVDDTIMVQMALSPPGEATAVDGALPPDLQVLSGRAAGLDAARRQAERVLRSAAARDRARAWVLAMQNRDGGWGAFDRDNDSEFLCAVPFADHNAMIDPSTPDLAGRVLEMLGQDGFRAGHPAVDRALAYVRRTQQADGSWFGRWGVNYIYGTWQVLVGLAAVGVPADDPVLVAGVQWLLAHQQPSGGWGESPASYAEPHLRGHGPTTASQTAWALLGLIAAGQHRHPAVARGIRYLLAQQRSDGSWHEPEFTGTGFPQVFYLRYHLYPQYFPLLALSRWAVAIGASIEAAREVEQCLYEVSEPWQGESI
jgi:squalene-hopene/tetraprenyl-beta-curcumene cyclase